jgi:hypothetical protein
MVFPVAYGKEDVTDVQCSRCLRVLRFQALLFTAEEAEEIYGSGH